MTTRAPRRVAVFGREAELLAASERGDGRHAVLKFVEDGRPVVVKFYGSKRGWLKDLVRHVGHRLLVGKSGMAPITRLETEREVLMLWRAHGFDVPAEASIELPEEAPPLRLALEWIDGRPMDLLLLDASVPLEEKRRRVAQCAREWSRRHDLAIELGEPRLVHSHAGFSHVLAARDRLASIDFEVVWTRSDVARLVSLELADFLLSLGKSSRAHELEALLRELVSSYAARSRLERVASDARRGRLPAFAWITRIGLRLKQGGPQRKLEMLRRLEAALARAEPA